MESQKPLGEKFGYLDIASIDNKNNKISEVKFIATSDAPSRASRKVKFGDTLFSMVRPYLRNIAFVEKEYSKCIASTGFYICSPNKTLYSKFLFYLMLSEYVVEGVNKYMKGDNSPSINNENITNFLYPLPPLSEQRRIVEKIEELLALVDDLETNKTDLQSYIKQAKSKVLEMAVRGELVPQNPEDEPASVLLERFKKEKLSQKSKGKTTEHNTHYEEELPFDIPENWALTRMENICQLLDGEKKQGVELPYLDVKFLRGKIEGEIKESGKYIPKNTHLILVDGENSGEIFKAQQDGYQGSTLKILNISEEICKKYIFYILKKEQKLFKESKTGSAIPHLNKKLFNDLLIFLPPLAEQYRIVEKIEHIFAVLEELEKNIL